MNYENLKSQESENRGHIMKYSIAQITSSAELETQNKNLQNQSSDYKFDSLRDTIKMCYEPNQKWMLDHYKKDVILIHVPIEIKD